MLGSLGAAGFEAEESWAGFSLPTVPELVHGPAAHAPLKGHHTEHGPPTSEGKLCAAVLKGHRAPQDTPSFHCTGWMHKGTGCFQVVQAIINLVSPSFQVLDFAICRIFLYHSL